MAAPAVSPEALYRFLIDEAVDYAIFLLDPAGLVETWNHGATTVFGFEPQQIIGRHFSNLFVEEDRVHGIPQKELERAAKDGRAEDTRWHLRSDGRAFFADGVTTALRDDRGVTNGFVKITRDVTERHRTEQRIAAQLALTTLLSDEQPVNVVARRVMQAICENLGWDIGALWKVDEKRAVIDVIDFWCAEHVDGTLAAELCTGHTFVRGEGIPGQTWEAAEALWIPSLDDTARYPRANVASRAGMRVAFAFPIVQEGKTKGVMEFFSRQQREPDQPLMPVMTLIGAQIGDFIDRHRTSQALRESEEHYRLVSETAQDAIFTIDADSTILSCNPAVERIFGYRPAELVGQSLEVIIPPRLRAAHHSGIARFLRTGKQSIPWQGIELPGLHRDGHEFPAEMSFGVWQSEKGPVFTGYARDITERKRTADDLQRSLEEAQAAREQVQRRVEEEASFRHLASALTGAVEMTEVLYEITNRATLVTRADGVYVERMVGSDGEVEVVATAGRGTPPRGLRVAYPGSMTEEIIKRREPVILADMTAFGRSMAPYLADSCAQCQVLVTPLIADAEPLGALVLLNSRHSGRELRETDVVRARTLGDLASLALRRVYMLEQERRAKERAEAAVRVRDETLGVVSHDLRNPLTKISLSADLLANAPADEQQELVTTIRTAARQMDRLIQDLLDVARLESGRFSIGKAMIDPEPIVRNACESNRAIAEQREQRIICNIEGTLPEICADRDRLVQVFGNLIGNAMKFTPERGTITIDARPVSDGVMFRVTDTGPGIPEGDLKNLFRPYYQARKTAHLGAGLGLAIVRGIVEAHGGTVSGNNSAHGGAVFTFTIPRG